MSDKATEAGADHGRPEDGETSSGSWVGVLSGAWQMASKGPRLALDLAQKGVTEAEKLALSTLRKRMDAVTQAEDPYADGGATPEAASAGFATTHDAPARSRQAAAAQTAAEAMARLMDASLEQSADSARELLALRTVQQLVPDEARILAALADGHASALLHLGAGMVVGPATQRWLENLSPVGREAGVALIERTPQYIAHLRNLGLLESGDEDRSLQLKYQLIEADTQVRKACEEIEKSKLRPKFIRRTIRMSEAGKAFWAACEPKDRQSW